MGWTYNTTDPNAVTNAPTITAVGITFCTLSGIIVLLRLYVRSNIVRKVAIDDWIIAATWIMSLGFTVVTILQTKWGLGLQHLSDMPAENIFNFGLLQYIGAPFYILSILGFKLSLLFSFFRIAVQKIHRYAIVGIICATCAFHLCFLVVQINLCNPVAKQWDPKITTGSCVKGVPFYTSMASITIVFDVIIMLLPFPVLLKTRIPSKKKIVLLGLFGLGTFVTVIQLIRILTIKNLKNYIDSSMLIMWSMVENNTGIIVASVPTLSPLVRSWREASSARTGSGQRGTSYTLGSMGGRGIGKSGRHAVLSSKADSNRVEDVGHITSETMIKGGMSITYQGENSSEEYIIESHDGIRATTEISVSSTADGTVQAKEAKHGGVGQLSNTNPDPFGDPNAFHAV